MLIGMKKLPLGIQTIEKILDEYVYVDKTDLIKDLIVDNSPHYFLSRPRRFGKSLLVSTLKAIFEGKKKLFKRCAIYQSDYKWKRYPILHFDFSCISSIKPDDFEPTLIRTLVEFAEEYDLSIEVPTVEVGLKKLIKELAFFDPVVILIDEYDYPIIHHLEEPEVAKSIRRVLRGFYATLKGLDHYIRFTFVTGISKFSQVSLFSGPNYLTDLTMDTRYAGLLGYTEDEVKAYFAPFMEAIAEERQITPDAVLDEVRSWYNGYQFTCNRLKVYNPYSTLNYMYRGYPSAYWYRTGTPAFLIDQVKKHPANLAPLDNMTATETALMDISSLEDIDLTALMFQTGYLTIQKTSDHNLHTLGFPNLEVKEAFLVSLVKCFGKLTTATSAICQEALELNNLDLLFLSKFKR